MTQGFIGNWRVTESVYLPNGAWLGEIHQDRHLVRLDDGQIRITQHCRPLLADSDHSMQSFAGEWVFHIQPDGRYRYYVGEDVVGTGLAWGDGVITGRGVWTRFAHSFTSFSVMLRPTRQLTGGCFLNGGATTAVIVGVAVPADEPQPHLIPEQPPVGTMWHGTRHCFDANGHATGTHTVMRHEGENGYAEDSIHYNRTIHYTPVGKRQRVTAEGWHGVSQVYGALRLTTIFQTDDNILYEMIDVHDSQTSTLFQLVWGYQHHVLQRFEWTKFVFSGGNHE